MALILEFGAVIMTREMFSRPLKYLWDKYRDSKGKNKGEAPSKSEADKMRSDEKNRQTEQSADAQRSMDRMAPEITIRIEVTNYNVNITKVQNDRTNRVIEDTRSNYLDINARQAEGVRTHAQYGKDTKISEMTTKIGQNKTSLDPTKTSTEQLGTKLDVVKNNTSTVHDNLPVETTKYSSKTTIAEKAQLESAQKANKIALDIQKEIDKSTDTSRGGDEEGIEMDDLPKGEK